MPALRRTEYRCYHIASAVGYTDASYYIRISRGEMMNKAFFLLNKLGKCWKNQKNMI
ncbi:MAG: hypothetical protein ACRC6X_01860 [Culicoidibacterales bacterium]